MKSLSGDQRGFTIVEIAVAIVVITIFLGSFVQIYLTVMNTNTESRWRTTASDRAYEMLRFYGTKPSIACGISTDMTNVNFNGNGQQLYTLTDNNHPQLPNPVVITVRAFAPRGCTPLTDKPVKIESFVRYGTGSQQKEVVHATYVY